MVSKFTVIRTVTPFHPSKPSGLTSVSHGKHQGGWSVIQGWIFDGSSLKILISGNNMLNKYKPVS